MIHTFYVFICQMWLQVMESPLTWLPFFGVFSCVIDDHSCLKNWNFTKLSQIMCLINIHILVYQRAKCNCRVWKVPQFNCVFWEFPYNFTCLKLYNFTKLLQSRNVEINPLGFTLLTKSFSVRALLTLYDSGSEPVEPLGY